MNSQLTAALLYLRNKAIAIIVLVLMMLIYIAAPDKMPFLELLYVAIMVLACVVVPPFLRLLVFAEAAEFAESNKLRDTLKLPSWTPALLHYWYATAICYAIVIACLSTITH